MYVCLPADALADTLRYTGTSVPALHRRADPRPAARRQSPPVTVKLETCLGFKLVAPETNTIRIVIFYRFRRLCWFCCRDRAQFELQRNEPPVLKPDDPVGRGERLPLCQDSCRTYFNLNETPRWAMNRNEQGVSGRTKSSGHCEDAPAAGQAGTDILQIDEIGRAHV